MAAAPFPWRRLAGAGRLGRRAWRKTELALRRGLGLTAFQVFYCRAAGIPVWRRGVALEARAGEMRRPFGFAA
ncbi:hypothetical protein VK98_03595 [Chromobacterium sp. LK11]|nr:hypothetical protein VK98_03595 [Chromobacterium sp. LK11]